MSKLHVSCKFFLSMALLYLSLSTNAFAGNFGAVTALSTASSTLGVFVGYSSGVVALCARGSSCQVYSGTPKSAVTEMVTGRLRNFVSVWVGYKNGDVYFCEISECSLLTDELKKQDDKEDKGLSHRIKVPQPIYLKQPNQK